jgi:hypothetical protein
MGGLESAAKSPELLDAAGLVNAIAKAGPAGSLSVRIRSEDGKEIVGMGRTGWRDDRAPGGPVVIFPHPNDPKVDALIPLGGNFTYDRPPKIISSAQMSDSEVVFGEIHAHQRPIDPIAEKYSFELVSKKERP